MPGVPFLCTPCTDYVSISRTRDGNESRIVIAGAATQGKLLQNNGSNIGPTWRTFVIKSCNLN